MSRKINIQALRDSDLTCGVYYPRLEWYNGGLTLGTDRDNVMLIPQEEMQKGEPDFPFVSADFLKSKLEECWHDAIDRIPERYNLGYKIPYETIHNDFRRDLEELLRKHKAWLVYDYKTARVEFQGCDRQYTI